MKRPYYAVATLTPLTSVGYLIKRCGSMMAAIAEDAFQGKPLKFTEWVVMMALRAHDSHMSPTRLSEETGYDMGALTRVVDGLERKGYVRRGRNDQDRRAVEITLTNQGRDQAEACLGLIVDCLNQLVEPFSKREIDTLIPLLQRLHQRLDDYLDGSRGKSPAVGGHTASARKSRRTA
jgi:DNA-binding MarR family transcriptional regulator